MASARGLSSILARRSFYDSVGAMSRNRVISTAQGGGQFSLKKIDARVFCLGNKGGNPVTIFASPKQLSGSLQKELAESCDWESVMVGTDASSSFPTMAFFMPSGEEVSFCAHAAIGGAISMGGDSGSWHFRAAMTGETFKVDTKNVGDGDTIDSASSSCCLHMKDVQFEEAPLGKEGMASLEEWSNKLGWSSRVKTVPTNASVARPKTLVELETVEAVHNAGTPPLDGSFAQACATMDDSTGVYVYSPHSSEINSYECRQFPRSSGYPEDPATGIAAAALAASLRFGGHGVNQQQAESPGNNAGSLIYNIYQGTAMGRPSLIQIMDLERHKDGKLSFGIQGRVEIDAETTIEVND